MQGLIFKALFFAVNRLVGAGLFDVIKEVVMLYAGEGDLTGEQKKLAVRGALKKLEGDLKMVYLQTSSSLLNLAIEAAVVWAKQKAGA